jgi:Ca2+-binding EF-hand superfamily protein
VVCRHKIGLSVIDINKLLHKGGKLRLATSARKDAIFQAELRSHNSPLSARRGKKDRATQLSEAKQALHGFVIRSKEDQLQTRAELVAPSQLEALLHGMSSHKDGILDLFIQWDADGDGFVSSEEFAAAVVRMGFKFSKEVTHELFAFFDKDGSDEVTLEEMEQTLRWSRDQKGVRPLLAGWRQLSLKLDEEQPLHEQLRVKLSALGKHPQDLFKHWDEEGDGSLDKAELAELMKTLGGMTLSDAENEKLFNSFDVDHSGRISFKGLNAKLREEVPIEKLMNALAALSSSGGGLHDFFSTVDRNGDGLLDLAEFEGVLQQLGVVMPSEHALHGLFEMLDQDGSGSISMKELQLSLRWVRSCEQCQKLRSHAYTFDGVLSIQQQIRRALAANAVRVVDLFREWDENDDGLLSAAEFRHAMPLIGIHAAKDEINELFNSMDADRDGIVTFKEFNRALRKEHDQMQEEAKRDQFGRDTSSDWRPKSPRVAPADIHNLRHNCKAELKLRGLDHAELEIKKPLQTKRPSVADAQAHHASGE